LYIPQPASLLILSREGLLLTAINSMTYVT